MLSKLAAGAPLPHNTRRESLDALADQGLVGFVLGEWLITRTGRAVLASVRHGRRWSSQRRAGTVSAAHPVNSGSPPRRSKP